MWHLEAAKNSSSDSIKIVLEATLESIGEGLVNDKSYDKLKKHENFKIAREWGEKQIKDIGVAQVQVLVAGFETDLQKKYDWVLEAAKNGSARAQNSMGIIYYQFGDDRKYSKIVNKDYIEAYKWHLVSLRNGLSPQRSNLEKIVPNLTTEQIKIAHAKADEWVKKYPQEKDEYANKYFWVSK